MTEEPVAATAAAPKLVRIRLADGQPAQVCRAAEALEVIPGRRYVVSTADGERIGAAASFEPLACGGCRHRVSGTVSRPAHPADEARDAEQSELRAEVLAFCRRRARELELPVRPVAAVTALDRDTVVVSFAAEQRVDVRALAKEVSRWARRRVELRSIGVRDQAKTCGGLGHCGRVLCCTSFMSRFTSVTVRMAKAQNLALNPARISGMCGRLMCCLAHEAQPVARPPADAAAN